MTAKKPRRGLKTEESRGINTSEKERRDGILEQSESGRSLGRPLSALSFTAPVAPLVRSAKLGAVGER